MKKSFFLILIITLLSFVLYAEDEKQVVDPYLITPGISVGSITEKTTELDLVNQYGVENVRSTTRIDDQNVTVTETILFPFDHLKKLTIKWTNGDSAQGPEYVRFEGYNTLWHTVEGVTLGSSLIDLENMNGTFFHMTGFNLTNPGEVIDCGDGNLRFLGYKLPEEEDIKGKTMILRLDPGSA
jgi:hypothetical protein